MSEPIIEHQTAVVDTFFQSKPSTNGPIKQPAKTPQLKPIKYAMAETLNFSLSTAKITEMATKTKHNVFIVQLTRLSDASGAILPL